MLIKMFIFPGISWLSYNAKCVILFYVKTVNLFVLVINGVNIFHCVWLCGTTIFKLWLNGNFGI